jgi:glucose/arabinose dehydrogenase
VKPGFLVAAAAAAVVAFMSAPSGAVISVTTELVTNEVQSPIYLAVAPGDTQRLFIVERAGRIRIVTNGVLLETPFVDIADQVDASPPEGALSSLAFHPDYQSNGYFYVTYTDLNSDGVVARLQATGDPDVADPGSLTVLLTVTQPGPNHNVDWVDFGPDGFLYIAVGDGGNNTLDSSISRWATAATTRWASLHRTRIRCWARFCESMSTAPRPTAFPRATPTRKAPASTKSGRWACATPGGAASIA